MTREDEIKKQADIYTDNASNYAEWSDDGGWSETNDIELVEKAFIEGAKWADRTMIDKAYEWIKENINVYAYKLEKKDFPFDFPLTERIVLIDNFDEDFKAAMEE